MKSIMPNVRGWCLSYLGVMALLAMVCGPVEAAPWLRYPAISPDGNWIAYSAQGDLWVVPTKGGRARLLTSHVAYERSPVWSPDSRSIVFASDRHGNFDLFRIQIDGGHATRLTFHSATDEVGGISPDGLWVLFGSRRQDDHRAAVPHSSMGELYRIRLSGGRPEQVLTTPAELAVYSPNGRYIAYHDYKGYEDRWRKHHISAVTRDLWLYDTKSKKHKKLTAFRGEDRNPVWTPDGKSLWFLSERDGTFNVWQMAPFADQPDKTAKRITSHRVHPVRFLSASRNGTICYGYNGTIWVRPAGRKSRRVAIQLPVVERSNRVEPLTLSRGVTEMVVAPSEEEVAFVIRGELFVTSVKYPTTRRITSTPVQERSVSWSPDSRKLYYASERDGSWSLYQSRITRDDEPDFAHATLVTEEIVLRSADETFQPLISPDGKKVAYLHNRDEIRLLDLDTKKTTVLVPAKWNYSYSDGDIHFDWSPDSRWLAFNYLPHHRWITDIGIVEISTGKIYNISNSGYTEDFPRFSPDGRVLLFDSDRLGRRAHGSWGSDADVFGFYLNREAWEWSELSKEELELRKKREEQREKKDSAKGASGKGSSQQDKEASEKEDAPADVKIETDNIDDRVKRLTRHSAPLGDFTASPDGEILVYFAQEENAFDLWATKLREGTTWKIAKLGTSEPGELQFSKDGRQVFVRYGGRMAKVSVPTTGMASPSPISHQAEMELDRAAERAYLFEHVWRQVKRKFYREDLHGVNWDAMKKNYQAFLPSINNNRDFAELLSEMLGELNASHTGARYRPRGGDATATLGILFDVRHRGVGLKVAEVLKRGPADRPDSRIRPGVLVTHIDGNRLAPQVNPWRLLNKKAGKPVRLSLTDPKQQKDWEEVLVAESWSSDIPRLYRRWLQGRRKLVDRLSNSRIGYVHVQSMNDASFRRTYMDVLGRNSDKEALVVDTRFNGGGWLHDDLVSFLSGEDYIWIKPRGKKRGDLGAEPQFRWSRPVAVVQSESNYSDAHMFPFAFKTLGIGKLIGTPVAGTGTAVWWETLIDSTLVFGIPQVGMLTKEGEYLENTELLPDVEVYNTPESIARGEDRQLAKAVEVLLREIPQ